MNPYQKQDVPLESLLPMLVMPEHDEIPHIIVSISPCRSGTTAMLRVMGNMGVSAYFQPLKNLLRWKMQGQLFSWTLPVGASKTIYIKETLGPYSLAEATFNPLSLLLQAGVPPHKLHIWIYGRYPLHSYASWLKWWQDKTNLNYFTTTYQTIAQIYQQAIDANIITTTLTYEVLGRYPITLIIARLAQRFGLTFTNKAVTGWQSQPHFGSIKSKIFLPEEPPIFVTPHIHDRVYKASEFTFVPVDNVAVDMIHQIDRQQMESSGIFMLYDQWEANCLRDLQLLALDRG